jgi:regulator of replication initiation timing
VHLDKHRDKLYAIFLLPDWEKYVSPEVQPVIEPDIDITDPVTMDEDLYFDKMAKALLRQVGQILNTPQSEPTPTGATTKELSYEDREKIREARRVVEALAKLNTEHEELKRRYEHVKDRNAKLAQRLDERDMETHKELSTQLQMAKNQVIQLVNENGILERSVTALKKQLSRQLASQPGTDPVRKRVTRQEVEDLDNLRRMLEERPHTGHE